MAFVAGVTAIIGLCLGHLNWARISTRTPLAIAFVGAFAVFVAAAAIAGPSRHRNDSALNSTTARPKLPSSASQTASESTARPLSTATQKATGPQSSSSSATLSSTTTRAAAAVPTVAAPTSAKVNIAPLHTSAASARPPVAPVTTKFVAPPAVVVTPKPAPLPVAAAPAATCHPLTNSQKCYEPGEFCRSTDHGKAGVAGDGKVITCEDNDGWRWEPS